MDIQKLLSESFYAIAPIVFPFGKKMGPVLPSKAIMSFDQFLTLSHKVKKTNEAPLLTDKGFYVFLERSPRDPLYQTMPKIYIHFDECYGHKGADHFVKQSRNVRAWTNVIDSPETVLRHNIDELNKKYIHAKGCMYSMRDDLHPSPII